MTTESRAEYEAYVNVVARFSNVDTLQTLINESLRKGKDQVATKALLAEAGPQRKTWRSAMIRPKKPSRSTPSRALPS